MPSPGATVSSALRIGPVLAVLAVAGYLLGGCGGDGGAGGALSGLSGTRPDVTLPTVPTRTETAPPTTAEAPTSPTETETVTEPTTTVPTETEESTTTTLPTTSTGATDTESEEPPSDNDGIWAWIALALAAARGETTTDEATTTEEAPTTDEAPTTTDEAPSPIEPVDPASTSSESSTPWGWILLALGLALAALVAGLVIWRRRRAGAASWRSELADLARRSLIATDDVAREGSVVTGQIQALAAEARSLEARAPDEQSRAAVGPVRERLDGLAGALEADRALRLGSPPPGADQLSYSTALVQEQLSQLRRLLRPAPAGGPPA